MNLILHEHEQATDALCRRVRQPRRFHEADQAPFHFQMSPFGKARGPACSGWLLSTRMSTCSEGTSARHVPADGPDDKGLDANALARFELISTSSAIGITYRE